MPSTRDPSNRAQPSSGQLASKVRFKIVRQPQRSSNVDGAIGPVPIRSADRTNSFFGSMSDATTEVKDPATDATPEVEASATSSEDTTSFTERYSEVLGKVNKTLDQVDWNQMGRIGKIVGIFAAVIVAQILIKGILDTINLLPVVPGLLELLGVVVVGQWSWTNLTTSDKRSALVQRVQSLRQEYLG